MSILCPFRQIVFFPSYIRLIWFPNVDGLCFFFLTCLPALVYESFLALSPMWNSFLSSSQAVCANLSAVVIVPCVNGNTLFVSSLFGFYLSYFPFHTVPIFLVRLKCYHFRQLVSSSPPPPPPSPATTTTTPKK